MSIATEIQRLQTAKADIKSAIENKGVTVGDGTIDTYAEKIGEISVGGGGINPLKYAVTIPSFQSVDFTDCPDFVVEVPNFNGKNITGLVSNTTNLQSVKLICNVRNVPMTATTAFYLSQQLKNIDLSEFNTLFNGSGASIFGNCVELQTIMGALDFSNVYTLANAFSRCNKLKEITIAEKGIPISVSFSACSLLNDTSIQSIIDGLADLTGGTAQTLTFHATVGGKLTDEQKATITAKNWSLVY